MCSAGRFIPSASISDMRVRQGRLARGRTNLTGRRSSGRRSLLAFDDMSTLLQERRPIGCPIVSHILRNPLRNKLNGGTQTLSVSFGNLAVSSCFHVKPRHFLADFPNRAACMPEPLLLERDASRPPTQFDLLPFRAPSPERPHDRASPRPRQGAREFSNNPEGRGFLRKFQARCAGLACSLSRARRCAANGPTGRRGPKAEGVRNGHRDH